MQTYLHPYPDYEEFGEESPPVIPVSERPKAGKPPDRSWWLVGALFCFVVVVIVIVFADNIDR